MQVFCSPHPHAPLPMRPCLWMLVVKEPIFSCRRLRCSLVFGFRVHNASRGNHQRKLPFTFIRQTPLELIFRERLQGTRVLTPSMKWRLASFIPTVIYRKLGNAPTPSYSSCAYPTPFRSLPALLSPEIISSRNRVPSSSTVVLPPLL